MRVLVTGQVGLEKSEYLKAAQGIADKKGVKIKCVTLGERMIESYEGKIDDRTILNLPKALLDLLRRYAWREIVTEAEKAKTNEIFIVNAHAVFRWHHGFFPAIDLDLLLELKPDCVVTLIDDVDKVKERLKERETDFFQLWELLAWREEEVWLSRFLTYSLKKLTDKSIKHFILPREQGPGLLVRVLSEKETPKVYMSFAVTGLPRNKKKEVDAFKEKVTAAFIGFDPLAMQERGIVTMAESLSKEIGKELEPVRVSIQRRSNSVKKKKRRWSLKWDELSPLALSQFQASETSVDGRDVLGIFEAIDSQIISRDFLLIDQSDFVLMFIRTDSHGTPQISAGSQSEMLYAYSQGKPVYVVCPGGRRALSPWVTQFSEVFVDLPEAFQFLSSRYGLQN